MSPGVEGLAYSNKWAGLNKQGQRTQDTGHQAKDSGLRTPKAAGYCMQAWLSF